MRGHERTTRDWRPARTSTRIAGLATFAIVGVLLWHVEQVFPPVVLGSVGAGLFTLSCWLLSLDRPVATPLASLLTVPVAAGLLGSLAVIVLELMGELFPVPDASLVSVETLVVAGHAGVVLGCVLAVLGFSLGYWHVLEAETLARYSKVTFLTASVPVVAGIFLLVNAVAFGGGPLAVVGSVVSTTVGWLIAPDPRGLNLAGFLFVAALALASLRVAVGVLPVAELLGDRGAGRTGEQRVRAFADSLTRATVAVFGLQVLALALELFLSTESILGEGLYGLVQGIVTAPALRAVLVLVAVLALCGVIAGVAVRRVARESIENSSELLGSLVGGVLVTLLAVVVADPVYTGTVETVADPIPKPISTAFRDISATVADAFGEETIVVLFAAAVVGTTLALVLALRLGLVLGYLSRETAGYSLATAGLFTGVVFAGTIGEPTWLVFGGLVGSLLVWDSGRFATTLGREIGRETDSREVELAHAGATVAVGFVGAVIATGVAAVFGGGIGDGSATTPVALLAVVAGILALVAALR